MSKSKYRLKKNVCKNKFDDFIYRLKDKYSDVYLNGILMKDILTNTAYINRMDEYLRQLLKLYTYNPFIKLFFTRTIRRDPAEQFEELYNMGIYIDDIVDIKQEYVMFITRNNTELIIFKLENGQIFQIENNVVTQISDVKQAIIFKYGINNETIFYNIVHTSFHNIHDYISVFTTMYAILDLEPSSQCPEFIEFIETFETLLDENYQKYTEFLDEDLILQVMDIVSQRTAEKGGKLSKFRSTSMAIYDIGASREIILATPKTLEQKGDYVFEILKACDSLTDPDEIYENMKHIGKIFIADDAVDEYFYFSNFVIISIAIYKLKSYLPENEYLLLMRFIRDITRKRRFNLDDDIDFNTKYDQILKEHIGKYTGTIHKYMSVMMTVILFGIIYSINIIISHYTYDIIDYISTRHLHNEIDYRTYYKYMLDIILQYNFGNRIFIGTVRNDQQQFVLSEDDISNAVEYINTTCDLLLEFFDQYYNDDFDGDFELRRENLDKFVQHLQTFDTELLPENLHEQFMLQIRTKLTDGLESRGRLQLMYITPFKPIEKLIHYSKAEHPFNILIKPIIASINGEKIRTGELQRTDEEIYEQRSDIFDSIFETMIIFVHDSPYYFRHSRSFRILDGDNSVIYPLMFIILYHKYKSSVVEYDIDLNIHSYLLYYSKIDEEHIEEWRSFEYFIMVLLMRLANSTNIFFILDMISESQQVKIKSYTQDFVEYTIFLSKHFDKFVDREWSDEEIITYFKNMLDIKEYRRRTYQDNSVLYGKFIVDYMQTMTDYIVNNMRNFDRNRLIFVRVMVDKFKEFIIDPAFKAFLIFDNLVFSTLNNKIDIILDYTNKSEIKYVFNPKPKYMQILEFFDKFNPFIGDDIGKIERDIETVYLYFDDNFGSGQGERDTVSDEDRSDIILGCLMYLPDEFVRYVNIDETTGGKHIANFMFQILSDDLETSIFSYTTLESRKYYYAQLVYTFYSGDYAEISMSEFAQIKRRDFARRYGEEMDPEYDETYEIKPISRFTPYVLAYNKAREYEVDQREHDLLEEYVRKVLLSPITFFDTIEYVRVEGDLEFILDLIRIGLRDFDRETIIEKFTQDDIVILSILDNYGDWNQKIPERFIQQVLIPYCERHELDLSIMISIFDFFVQ